MKIYNKTEKELYNELKEQEDELAQKKTIELKNQQAELKKAQDLKELEKQQWELLGKLQKQSVEEEKAKQSFLQQNPSVTKIQLRTLQEIGSESEDSSTDSGDEENSQLKEPKVKLTEELKEIFRKTKKLKSSMKSISNILQQSEKEKSEQTQPLNQKYYKKSKVKLELDTQNPVNSKKFRKNININQVYSEGHGKDTPIGHIRPIPSKSKYYKIHMLEGEIFGDLEMFEGLSLRCTLAEIISKEATILSIPIKYISLTMPKVLKKMHKLVRNNL